MNQASAATRAVVVEREVPFPPERIWRALTPTSSDRGVADEERLQASRGPPLQSSEEPQPDVSIVVDCQVLAVEPHKTLSYSWAAYGLESVVTWTLTPTRTGTLLRMEQSGFRPDQTQAYHGARYGWQQYFAALEQALARMD
jgi:uncharacterized protein YndB with AHSA1/START domain